jgi:hypothetical protein
LQRRLERGIFDPVIALQAANQPLPGRFRGSVAPQDKEDFSKRLRQAFSTGSHGCRGCRRYSIGHTALLRVS